MNIEKKPKKGAPSWMVSFADLQQLLLVFFVLLYSTASKDTTKLAEVLSSFQNGTGLFKGEANKLVDLDSFDKGDNESKKEEMKKSDLEKDVSDKKNEYLEKINQVNSNESEIVENQINDELKKQGFTNEQIENSLDISNTSEGVQIRLKDNVIFDLGSTTIKNDSEKILNSLASTIKNTNRHIRVEGHTDNIPVSANSKYSSNWQISTERAISVMEYFVRRNVATRKNFSVSGYSEYKPIEKNDTAEHRSLNRRVDIVLLNE